MTTRIDFVRTDVDDLACHQGASFIVDMSVIVECSGLPLNLTGYSAALSIVETEVDGTETVIDTIAGTISNPADGSINFEIPPEDTEDYEVGIYSYFLELTVGATVYREAYGIFEVVR